MPADGNNGLCDPTFDAAISREGDMLRMLDVLTQDIGVIAVFADGPATVHFHANWAGLR